jgi:DNA polymerase-3 subunit delta'
VWSVIGHANALAALQRALASERSPHAWLFAGPEGVGKQTVALEFAAALNCTSDEALGADGSREGADSLRVKPCGECRACRDTLAGRHPDVELIAPGGMCDEPEHRDHADSRDLRICQIRRLERLLSLSPYAGGRRVAIVDAADTLRAEAANAFLKTLEEPPAGSVIILLAEREERLPETVLSRCQRLPFRPIEREAIVETLVARGAEPEDAETIASAAGGRLGWALQALEDRGLLEDRALMLDEALRLAHAGRAERFAWAREAEGRAPGIRERYLRELAVWEGWWRDVLLFGAGGQDGANNPDRAAALSEEGRLYSAAAIVGFLRSLAQTREYLRENVDPQLALENLTLDMPSARGFAQGAGRGR